MNSTKHTPTQPASDEEVDAFRTHSRNCCRTLIARVDAERARAEKAEAELTKWRTANMSDYYASGHYEQACDERDEWRARSEALERQLVAITDRLRDDTATLTARAERAEALCRAALVHLDGIATWTGIDDDADDQIRAVDAFAKEARAALSRKDGEG